MSRFYSRRKDTNHAPVLRAIEKIGATVMDTSRLGDDWPDLMVGWRGRTLAVEVKWQRHGETDGQRKRREAWRGDAWLVVTDPQDAVLKLVQVMTGGSGAAPA